MMNPKSKMIKVFFPSTMLIIFLACTYMLEVGEDGLADKIGNLSIVLLTFVEILDKNRSELPSIQALTIIDGFLMFFILTSCLPLSFIFVPNVEG